MKRHIGKIANTDQRCVVVFLQIPGRESHSLVVTTDNLPAHIEQALMEVLESSEGQGDPTLANVLSRRLMGDTGKSVLQTLHERQLLQAVPVDNMVMLPKPNMPFPLRRIIEEMGGKVPPVSAQDVPSVLAEVKYNPYGNVQEVVADEKSRAIAANLIYEAELLESEAKRKREEAYRYDGSLRPKVLESTKTQPAAKKSSAKKVEVTEATATKVVKKRTPKKKAEA